VQVKDIIIPYKTANHEFRLFLIGDIHAGTIHCVEADIRRKVNEIAQSKNTYWIGMGDYAEWITPKDKRFDPNSKSIAEWVEPDNIAHCQTKWLTELFTPIKQKCIGLLFGNHENSIRIYNHDNVQQNLCDALGLDNLGYSCFIRFKFRRENSTEQHLITGAFTHGSSGAITEGAKLMALMRWMKSMDADIYGYAHLHDYLEKSLTRMVVIDRIKGTGRIKSKTSCGVTTGAWFRTYTQGIQASYAETKCYPPVELGCALFKINPNTGEIKTEKSI
jgi:hypothetical protein